MVNGTAVLLRGTGDWPACLAHCHAFLQSLWPCLSPEPAPPNKPAPAPAPPAALPALVKPCRAVAGGPLFVDPVSDAFFATSNYQNVIKILGAVSPAAHACRSAPASRRRRAAQAGPDAGADS